MTATNEVALKLAREVSDKMLRQIAVARSSSPTMAKILDETALAAILEVTERAAKREDALAEEADTEWQERHRNDPEDEGSNYLWLRNRHRQGAAALRNLEHLS